MVVIVIRYIMGSLFGSHKHHLECKEVFGSMKQQQDLPLGLKGDSHMHDHMNFFHLWVDTISNRFTTSFEKHVGQSIGIVRWTFSYNASRVWNATKCLWGWHLKNWMMCPIFKYPLLCNERSFNKHSLL
jgi:hypothetical protein